MKNLIIILMLFVGVFTGYSKAPKVQTSKKPTTTVSKTQSVTFRTQADVWSYLSGRTFYNGNVRVRVTQQYLEINGQPCSGAPLISNITRTTASIIVTYPIAGNQRSTLVVNCDNGTLTEGKDVFKSK